MIGITLNGIGRGDVSEGMLLAARNSVRRCGRFDASVRLFAEEQGARNGPIPSGARCRFLMRTADIPGIIELTDTQKVVPLGKDTAVTVKLEREIGMEKGDRFVLHEQVRLVGVGTVTALLHQ
jgi:elongation factor Tu